MLFDFINELFYLFGFFVYWLIIPILFIILCFRFNVFFCSRTWSDDVLEVAFNED